MRLVAISDTHTLHEHITVAGGDALVHAGDFCGHGDELEVESFVAWMAAQPHRHKIAIAGNHDRAMAESPAPMAALFAGAGITYLRDSGCVIDGVKFWGSPWQPAFCDWSFNIKRGQLGDMWALIPSNTDVLITHGPPHGVLDACPAMRPKLPHNPPLIHVGCEQLREVVFGRVKPKVHIFGHIHEGYGEHLEAGIRFVNASNCTAEYAPINPPLMIEI